MAERERHRFDLFGRPIEVVREGRSWRAYFLGAEGKRRPAHDIVIPDGIAEVALQDWLDDMFHEYATAARPCVRRLPDPGC